MGWMYLKIMCNKNLVITKTIIHNNKLIIPQKGKKTRCFNMIYKDK